MDLLFVPVFVGERKWAEPRPSSYSALNAWPHVCLPENWLSPTTLENKGGKTGLSCVQTKSSEVTDELLIRSSFNTFLFLTDSQLGWPTTPTPATVALGYSSALLHMQNYILLCLGCLSQDAVHVANKNQKTGRPVLILSFTEEQVSSSKTALQERLTEISKVPTVAAS